MTNETKTVIVTGASQGIGASLVKTFLERPVLRWTLGAGFRPNARFSGG
jgi:NAD(P)-dependent dehydrogenase (short-subunit alcohol dehydrogenase family)